MMAVIRSKSVFMCVLTTLLTVIHTTLPSAAMDFRGMDENCILSFVVPRDKVKSSCDVEERVTRRLNAMETKVTLYKQHVQELQEQLTKEREIHRQRLEEVSQRMARNELNDVDGLLDKRIRALEDEVRKMRTTSFPVREPHSRGFREKPSSRGLGVERSRQEEEKATTNLVKAIVHSEVKKLFDNYTHYVGRYVRDQALAFNQIINMVPRNDQSFPNNNLPPKWPGSKPNGNELEQGSTQQPLHRDIVLLNELEGIRNRLNTTGKQLADRMEKVLQNVSVTATTAMPTPATATSAKAVPPTQTKGRDSDLEHTLLEVNDTASGDTNDTASDHNITLNFTHIGSNISSKVEDGEHRNVYVPTGEDLDSTQSGSRDAASAKSRMSYNTDVNKLPDTPTDNAESRSESESEGNRSRWKENMVHDQGAGALVQELLRTEIQKILAQQVDEMLSLVSKHSAMVDNKLHDQDRKFDQLEERLTADIKHLDQAVSGLKLELTSVSQGLQTLYSRTDKTEELEETVTELRRNISMEGNTRLLATLLDEQGKKVRKMERLTDIYKQSLEHYRNETKLEYRDLKERLEKEGTVLRSLNANLFHNVTENTKQLIQRVNTSSNRNFEEVKQRVQVMEDNSLLLQIDLSNFERQLKSKTSKSERDVNKLSDDFGDLKQRTRNLQKTLNAAVSEKEQLSRLVNDTSANVHQLQMEVKLNVLDEWMPYNFDYMKTRTDCFGDQFIRKSGFRTGRLVGVVLCSSTRYKIFLGQGITDTFKNIGDNSGMGEDHCQFVNAKSMSNVKVSPFRTSTETEPGYVRTHWGQEPRPELLNIIRPSPAWYECGVSIP